MSIAAAHDEELDGSVALYAIVGPFQPVVKPAHAERFKVERSGGTKLGFAREADPLPAMGPRAHD